MVQWYKLILPILFYWCFPAVCKPANVLISDKANKFNDSFATVLYILSTIRLLTNMSLITELKRAKLMCLSSFKNINVGVYLSFIIFFRHSNAPYFEGLLPLNYLLHSPCLWTTIHRFNDYSIMI